MKLTREDIEKGRSLNGGWSQRQLELLGVKWPLPKGWARSLVGMEVSEDAYRRFIAMKDQHLREKTLSRLADRMLKKQPTVSSSLAARQLSQSEVILVAERARMLISTFTDPKTKTGQHTTACNAVSCTYPACQCK